MRQILKILLAIGLLFGIANANGIKIFDLKEQYFSGTMLKKGQEGYGQEQRYDLPKVIVTTDTKYNGHSYMYGLFTVDIKEPLENWNVNIKKKNGTGYTQFTGIRLTSDNGSSHFISFNGVSPLEGGDTTSIDDKTFKTKRIEGEKLTVSVVAKNKIVYFKINGKTFLKTDLKDFGKLAKVEVELNDNEYDDELYALDIYKVK
jgi:hypothetical protein